MTNEIKSLANISFFRRGADINLTKNFHLRELECKCGLCPYTLVSIDHIKKIQSLRDSILAPIKILSGYRCHKHNENVGGEKNSMHTFGVATDIYTEAMNSSTLAVRANGFDGIGIYDTFVHLDSRGFTAFWDRRSP